MQGNILESLKGLKKIFNYYLTVVGLLILTWIPRIELFNKQGTDDSPINIFGADVYPYYFSLVYSLSFMLFILVLFLNIRHLRIIMEYREKWPIKERDSAPIILFPWLTSPFHRLRHGPLGFALSISLGFIVLTLIAISHFRGQGYPGQAVVDQWVYRYLIGAVGAISFVTCLILMLIAARDIVRIRNRLEYPESWWQSSNPPPDSTASD